MQLSRWLTCVSRRTKSWNDMGYTSTALAILNSILYKKDVVSPMVQPPYPLDRKLTGTHSRCAPRSGEEKNPLSLLGIEQFSLARGQVSVLTEVITCRATAQRLVAGLSSRRLEFNPLPVYVRSVVNRVALGYVSVLLLCFPLSASLRQWPILIHLFIHSFITDAGLVSSYQLTVSLNNTHSRGALKKCFSISGTRTTGGTFFWN